MPKKNALSKIMVVPLEGVPDDPFKSFDPFKGVVPIPHQFEFEDAAERARVLLKGWKRKDIVIAGESIGQLINQGEDLLEQDLRTNGKAMRTNVRKRITRAIEDRKSPMTVNKKTLSDSDIYAVLTLLAIASACKEQAALERMTDKTPDILAEEIRRAGQSITADLAVIAKEAIEHAERLDEMAKREQLEKQKRRQKAKKANKKRLAPLKSYQQRFIEAYVSGKFGKCTKKKAIYEFTSEYPPEDEGLGDFKDIERSLLEALRRYEKANPSPSK